MVASGKSPALAAWIGRRKYGAKGMAALSHHGEGGAPMAMAHAKEHMSPGGKMARARMGK